MNFFPVRNQNNKMYNISPSFKSNYYRVQPNNTIMFEVQTDDIPLSEKTPYVVSSEFQGLYKIPMERQGGLYYASFETRNPTVDYSLEYEEGKDLKRTKTYIVDK